MQGSSTYFFCIKLWLGTYFSSSILSLVLFWGERTVLYTVQASSNSKLLLIPEKWILLRHQRPRFDGFCHGLRTPRESFFSKIFNFWAWADIFGWNFMRHLGSFLAGLSAPILAKLYNQVRSLSLFRWSTLTLLKI